MDGLDLKIARLRAGVRGYELARHVGMTESMLSRIETGRRAASPDELADLVAAVDAIAANGRAPLAAGSRAAAVGV
jgi:transcriptional regulator with XRE-family HTH domain